MRVRNLSLICASSFLLAACSSGGDLRETLGFNRKAPDEFRVYARPSLTVPPDFNLRAPGTATDAPTATPADEQARSTVTGDTASARSTATTPVASHELPSAAEEQLLQKAGAHRSEPDVRTSIKKDAETDLTAQDSHYLINPSASGEPTVDANKEAERLKQNKVANKSPTEGDTPVVQPKSKGFLGTIGDWF